jgi:hypothetical protein
LKNPSGIVVPWLMDTFKVSIKYPLRDNYWSDLWMFLGQVLLIIENRPKNFVKPENVVFLHLEKDKNKNTKK